MPAKVNVTIAKATQQEVEQNRRNLEMTVSQIVSRITGRPCKVKIREDKPNIESA